MIDTKGTVTDVIYRNEQNGYTVFRMETDEGEITVVGKVMSINIGDYLSVFGELVFHIEYGEQIKLDSYEKIMPTSVSQIERYLSSGIISHIKKKRAREIVKLFGEDTIRVMMEEPERLLKISGIGKKTLEKIHEDIMNANESREISIYLQKFHLGNKMMADIYNRYKNKTIEIIERNPYQLVDDIKGIGFNTADKIALDLGVPMDSPFRIRSGVSHILLEAANRDGNCYLPKDIFIQDVSKILNLNAEVIENSISDLVFQNRIVLKVINKVEIVYLNLIYDIETSITSRLINLLEHKNLLHDIDVESEIETIERIDEIEYSNMQKNAIKTALTEKVMIITGGPGTGKTTIIRAIMSIMKNVRLKYALCAPTGRAAKRMEESTGNEASTIHRLLGYKSIEDEMMLEYNEENPLEFDVIIIDEMSMVDIFLMNNLLKAIDEKSIVIFVGDHDQLPSVGPGNVLNDMISSGVIPTIKLDRIFRQGEDSNIVKNAHLINAGNYPILNEKDKDFFFIHTKSDADTLNTIVDLVSNRLPSHYKVNPLKDIQVLSLAKRGTCGVENLNRKLQEALNPEEFNKAQISFGDIVYRDNDKVMQIKNNYDMELKDKYRNSVKGLYNGDIGYIKNVLPEIRNLEIDFDDKSAVYTHKEMAEITHSYCITVHKSQGSEFPIVIIPMASAPYMLLSRNILYTGITRGKSVVILVGNENIMRKMIDNKFKQNRNSTLDYYLKETKRIFGELHVWFPVSFK